MANKSDSNISKALELSRQMLVLAERGLMDSSDDSCRVLYGIIRDCAYKIKALAENECKKHEIKRLVKDIK
ncbi:MAG: hypothetical protein AB1599_03910 [Planctomycetota bacterium]